MLVHVCSQLYILLRKPLQGSSTGEWKLAQGARSPVSPQGLHVVTPLRPDPAQHPDLAGTVILVNRGWVPDSVRRQDRRLEGQVAGCVTVTGLLRRRSDPDNPVHAHAIPARVRVT